MFQWNAFHERWKESWFNINCGFSVGIDRKIKENAAFKCIANKSTKINWALFFSDQLFKRFARLNVEKFYSEMLKFRKETWSKTRN